MKKFIKKLIFFLLPILFVFIGVEFFIRNHPNTFNTKAKQFTENRNMIEVLFLGSSHTQDGINPRFLEFSASNLGYAGQDFEIDSALVAHYIKDLRSLKTIIWEIDFISLYKKREDKYFRYPWYKLFYGLDFGENSMLNDLSLYSSSPDFFNQYLRNLFFSMDNINQFGFNEAEDKEKFYKLNHDSLAIEQASLGENAQLEGNMYKADNFEKNARLVSYMKQRCEENNIRLVLMAYPKYNTYIRNFEDTPMYKNWKAFLEDERANGTQVWDLERDKAFLVTDFKNDSHLNQRGAEKLTKRVNGLL